MRHIDILNNVLSRLREDPALTVSDNAYTAMISDFVNDAMDMTQSVHNWHSLFTVIDITTVAGTQTYTLSGLGQMGQVYFAYNDDTDGELRSSTLEQIIRNTNMGGGTGGSPSIYAYDSVDASDDPVVTVWPIPTAEQSLKFHVKRHQGPITDGTVEVLMPEQPVIQLALAMAKEERGEDGSNGPSNAMSKAKAVLSDYVALDRERHPELMTWEVE